MPDLRQLKGPIAAESLMTVPFHASRSAAVVRTVAVSRRVEEAGRILGVSRGAAYAYAKDGSIPTIRLGKRLLVPKAELEKTLNVA
jgi:excisionase family DNA binding protein